MFYRSQSCQSFQYKLSFRKSRNYILTLIYVISSKQVIPFKSLWFLLDVLLETKGETYNVKLNRITSYNLLLDFCNLKTVRNRDTVTWQSLHFTQIPFFTGFTLHWSSSVSDFHISILSLDEDCRSGLYKYRITKGNILLFIVL